MRSFFKEHKLNVKNSLSSNRVNKIKYSVLSQIEGEERTMKKKFRLKTMIAAAAAAVVSAAATLAITAGAAWNGQPTYSVKINGEEVPYTVELSRGENYSYARPTDGKMLTVHDETTVIRYRLPEEIVTEGDGEAYYTATHIIDEDGNLVGADRTALVGENVVEGLPISYYAEVKSGSQFTVEVTYDADWLAQNGN